MNIKDLSKNTYIKIMGIIEGAFITPLAREANVHKKREGKADGLLEGKLTSPNGALPHLSASKRESRKGTGKEFC